MELTSSGSVAKEKRASRKESMTGTKASFCTSRMLLIVFTAILRSSGTLERKKGSTLETRPPTSSKIRRSAESSHIFCRELSAPWRVFDELGALTSTRY